LPFLEKPKKTTHAVMVAREEGTSNGGPKKEGCLFGKPKTTTHAVMVAREVGASNGSSENAASAAGAWRGT
jgi:hypothetical protein